MLRCQATGQVTGGQGGGAGWRDNAGPDWRCGGYPTAGFHWPLSVEGAGQAGWISRWP
ncbi:hypothetical protein AH4AK4_2563 [Aeromonas hydrophila 4AK4]|nr:hypothetical protein AH4AK4_2563 [Aeromonas hydrophila 4AK4]